MTSFVLESFKSWELSSISQSLNFKKISELGSEPFSDFEEENVFNVLPSEVLSPPLSRDEKIEEQNWEEAIMEKSFQREWAYGVEDPEFNSKDFEKFYNELNSMEWEEGKGNRENFQSDFSFDC